MDDCCQDRAAPFPREREKAPLFLPALFFAAGCYGGIQGWLGVITAWGGLFVTLGIWLRLENSKWHYPLFLISLFCLGFIHGKVQWFWIEQERLQAYKRLKGLKRPFFEGIVESFPQKRNHGLCFQLKLQAVRVEEKSIPLEGKLFCRVGDLPREPYLGQAVAIEGKVFLPPRKRNPGEIDYYKLSLQRRWLFELLSGDFPLFSIPHKDQFWAVGIEVLRRKIKKNLSVGIPEEGLRSLLQGMVYGDVSGMDSQLAEAFKRAGAYHLFAVSGQNVGIILGMGIFLLKAVGKNQWKYSFVFIPLLVVFSFVSGNGPSVVRACAACIYCILGWALKRKVNALHCWAVSLFAFLLYDPLAIMDIGLELSYAVVLSLLLLAKPLFGLFYSLFKIDPYIPRSLAPFPRRMLDQVGKIGALLLAASFAAWLGALPLEVFCFHALSWVGIFDNLIAVPLAELIVLLGSLSALGGFFSDGLACVLNGINRYFLWALVLVVDFWAKIPSAVLAVPEMKMLGHPACPWIYVAQVDSGHLCVIKNKNHYWLLNSVQGREEEYRVGAIKKALLVPPDCPTLTFQNGCWHWKELTVGDQKELCWDDHDGFRLTFRVNREGEFGCLVEKEKRKILFLSYPLPFSSLAQNCPFDLLVEHLLERRKNNRLHSSLIRIYDHGRASMGSPLNLEKYPRTFQEGIWIFLEKGNIRLESQG